MAEVEWGDDRLLRLRGRKDTKCVVGLFNDTHYSNYSFQEVIPSEVLLPADATKFMANAGYVSAIFREITPKSGLEMNARGIPELKAEAQPGFKS